MRMGRRELRCPFRPFPAPGLLHLPIRIDGRPHDENGPRPINATTDFNCGHSGAVLFVNPPTAQAQGQRERCCGRKERASSRITSSSIAATSASSAGAASGSGGAIGRARALGRREHRRRLARDAVFEHVEQAFEAGVRRFDLSRFRDTLKAMTPPR